MLVWECDACGRHVDHFGQDVGVSPEGYDELIVCQDMMRGPRSGVFRPVKVVNQVEGENNGSIKL